MKKVQNITTAILMGTALVLPTSASAFMHGSASIPGMGGIPGFGGGSSSKSVDAKGLTARTESVIRDFSRSMILFSDAVNLELDADVAQKAAECAAGKGCIDSGDKIVSIADKLKKHMSEMKSEGVMLDEDSKATFTRGLLPYGKGVITGADVLKDLPDALKSDPFALIGLVKVPSMLSGFISSSETIYDYATSTGAEIPKDDAPK